MADRLYCALNGTTLHDLDARIHLLDVEELAPAVRTVTASRIGGGLHLLRRQREQLSLRVRFLIEETTSPRGISCCTLWRRGRKRAAC